MSRNGIVCLRPGERPILWRERTDRASSLIITSGDRTSLTRAPGVGARLAVRLLTELRDKAGAMPSAPGFAVPRPSAPGVAEDAISALVNLGYRRPEAQPVVARVIERLGDEPALDAVIRESLKDLAHRVAG